MEKFLTYFIDHLPNLVVAGVFVWYLVTTVQKKDSLIAAKDDIIQQQNDRIVTTTSQTEKLIQALAVVHNQIQELKTEVRYKVPNLED